MSYEDVMKGLSAGTARVIGQLWAQVEAGLITVTDFTEVAADLVAVARAQGALAAQGALRAYLEATLGQAVAVAVLPAALERERILQALGTIVASDLDTSMQLARLANNEPLDAAADAYTYAMRQEPAVSGWRRGIESGACQLCTWWARDGRVFRTEHTMPRHPGCACHQVPVINEHTDNYQTANQAAAASRRGRNR